MEKLFSGFAWDRGDANMQSFNDDISRWDTSEVIVMSFMYCMFDDVQYAMFDNCPFEAKHKPQGRMMYLIFIKPAVTCIEYRVHRKLF